MTQQTIPTVSYVHPAELHESPDNPRTITDAKFDALIAALEADPAMLDARPIIATTDGEAVGGNMRLRAARKMLEDDRYPQFNAFVKERGGVPTFLAPLDERRKREWMLRDNAPYGSWEDEALAELVREYDGLDGADRTLLGLDDDLLSKALGEDQGAGGGGANDNAHQEEMPDLWGVVVECESEESQSDLLARLDGEGFKVRALL
jgi:hypothetical protein